MLCYFAREASSLTAVLTGASGDDPLQVCWGSSWRFLVTMKCTQKIVLLAAGLSFAFAHSNARSEDWLQWRGPSGNNHAPTDASAPTEWSETEGLAWATPLPGRGHSSPTLVGNRIYLTTADLAAETQSLLVVDRSTGRLLKSSLAHQGGLPSRIHGNNSHASPTVASDGQRVFALFCNEDAAWVTAFDLDGNRLWQQRAIGFAPQQYEFGFGSSPVVVDDLVIVTSEYDGRESGIVALAAASGKRRWLANRPNQLSYSSPARLSVAGKTQLLISGNYLLASYDATSGRSLWSVQGSTQATCGTMVWDDSTGLAYASGGYPEPFTLGVKLAGDHAIVWRNNVKCYEQSLLAHAGFVYGIADSGVAYCWRGTDGKEMWKSRLGRGGGYSASPLLVGGNLYVTSERGTTYVIRATPDRFDLLAENQLGNSAFATPTPGDGRLYHRFARDEHGRRQEYLVAIGQ